MNKSRALAKVASANRDTHGQDILFRSRVQIPLGILIAIVMPAIVYCSFVDLSQNWAVEYNTLLGGSLALVLGYISYRRLHVFPGIGSGGYIITTFTITFGALAAALIFLRLDYTRVQLLSSYLLTMGFFTFVHLKYVVRRPLRLGVIRGGGANNLPKMSPAVWHYLTSPQEEAPALQGVVVDLTADLSDEWNSRIAAFALSGTPVYHYKEVMEQLSGRVEIEHLSENTLGSLNPNDVYLQIKAALDFLAAAFILLLTFPLLLVIGIVIRLDSPGPSLYRQRRTGFRGRPFTAYKFRTMYVAMPGDQVSDAEARNRALTRDNDPRVTRVGRFLRRTRIDELPQLINMIKGEMSMIGPRPEAEVLTRWYETEIPFYHYRHIIKPGVTGWAQIRQGHVTAINEIQEKLNLDFYYVKNFSFWLDFLIVLKTLQTMTTGSGAR